MPQGALVPALYALICLIWGSTWLAIKVGLRGVPPFLGAGLRFLLASAVLGAIVAARRSRLALDADGRKAVLACGLLSFTLSYAGVYWAEQYISSGLTAVLYCLMPLFVALLSRFWTRSEALGPRKLAGILIGMAGTVMLFLPALSASRAQAAGMAAALASVLAAALNLVLIKKHARHVDVFVLNGYGMGLGAACLLALSALLERHLAVAWTPANALALVYLALLGSVVAFVSYFYLIKHMEATTLSLITLVFPIVAVLLGTFYLGERGSPAAWAGMATILAGVAITLTGPKA